MRILITAGPTREYFDSVRFISNPSSGKMGIAIAAEAADRGHEVDLILGPIALPAPPGVSVVSVTTAEEMFEAAVRRFEHCDAAVMTAAVCDYRPARKLGHKLAKRHTARAIRLVPTRDICAHLGEIKGNRVVVGFAMEDHDHHVKAQRKLTKKQCDAIVLNGIENVASDTARIEILRSDSGWCDPMSGDKTAIGGAVVDLVESLLTGRK